MAVDAAPATGVVRRPLSPLERWYWIADQVSPLNVIARARVHGHLPVPLLRQALDHLQARHPLLRVAIATGPGGANPRFVPRDTRIPLREVRLAGSVADADDRWVREINERELADRIDWRAGPLCRAVVVTAAAAGEGREGAVHDLVLTLPHCVADGTTVLSLIRDWLDAAAGENRDGAHALPSIEELLPRRCRGALGSARLKGQLLADLFRLRRYRPARVVPSRFVPFTERRTRLLHRSLPAAEVDALVRACRRERTTVHGALAAAMVTAVAGEADIPAAAYVAIGSPVNFRRDLVPPVPDDAVGAYVATVPSFVAYRPGSSIWPMARAISADLARRRGRLNHFAMVDLLRGSCPPSVAASGRLIERVETAGPVNLCISNLGRYDFPAAIGPWRVRGAQFVAGLSVCGYFVSTVNTSHDRLFWNFTYVADALPDTRAERLVDACVHTARSAIAATS
jgi:hypothetical protein